MTQPVDPTVRTESVYTVAGGRQAFLNLARAWHQRCLADPVVSHAFSHPGQHPEHTERLAAYWAEALGGPSDYTDAMGNHAQVLRIHSGNGEHREMDERAQTCFAQALDDAAFPDDDRLRRTLKDYFRWATGEMGAHPHSADEVPTDVQLPHWSWDGPVITDQDHRSTRKAWEDASQKHVHEYDELLTEARSARLLPIEERVLADIMATGPEVIHPQSGHGIDDHALIALGARSVLGLDYSQTAVAAAQRRADELQVTCRYEVAELPRTTAESASADLVYTGKGALIWMADLAAWAAEMKRLLRPGGHLFVYEAHPLVPLWAWDEDEARVRPDRSYFAAQHVNDTFPARGAIEYQHTMTEIIMTITATGFELSHVAEHPEPFWQPDGQQAAAWDGRLPNSFSLLALS